jgi:hypothetical protein
VNGVGQAAKFAAFGRRRKYEESLSDRCGEMA